MPVYRQNSRYGTTAQQFCTPIPQYPSTSLYFDDLPQVVGSLMTSELTIVTDTSVIDHAQAAQLFRWVGGM